MIITYQLMRLLADFLLILEGFCKQKPSSFIKIASSFGTQRKQHLYFDTDFDLNIFIKN